jgi:hypothetical protein
MLTVKQFLNGKDSNTIDYFNNLYKRFPVKNTRNESMKLYYNGLLNNGKINYKEDGLPDLNFIPKPTFLIEFME